EPSVGTPIAPAPPIERAPSATPAEPRRVPDPIPAAQPIEAPATKAPATHTGQKSKPREKSPVDPEPTKVDPPKAEPPPVPGRKGDTFQWPGSKPRPPAEQPGEPAADGSGAR